MMPALPVDTLCNGLAEGEAKLVRAAFKGNKLRATKPFRRVNPSEEGAAFKASANYVWRMLCFDYAGFSPHSCLPVTADFDMSAVCRVSYGVTGFDHENRRHAQNACKGWVDTLDGVIKRAESNLPITLQRGVMQWGRVL